VRWDKFRQFGLDGFPRVLVWCSKGALWQVVRTRRDDDGVIGGELGYRLLRCLSPGGKEIFRPSTAQDAEADVSKLERKFGPQIWEELKDKVVLDFGCGTGTDAIEIARHGAKQVIGLDIRQWLLAEATLAAKGAGVADRCFFCRETDEKVDVIVSLDAFEHFSDPGAILNSMRQLLKDNGSVFIEFGPPWHHPLGGHLFSVFPWAHLLFTERALIRWRSDFKSDGATRFGEVEGGLNQMTVRRFEELVKRSEFRFKYLKTTPIRKAKLFFSPLSREFLTAFVWCKLIPR
jgi:SAM-dependent methyltransferase